jgi:hypothetical protein
MLTVVALPCRSCRASKKRCYHNDGKDDGKAPDYAAARSPTRTPTTTVETVEGVPLGTTTATPSLPGHAGPNVHFSSDLDGDSTGHPDLVNASAGKLQSQPHSHDVSTRESTPGLGRASEYNPESVLTALSEAPESIPSVEAIHSYPKDFSLENNALSPEQTAQQTQRRQWQYVKRYTRRAMRPKLSARYRSYLEEAGAFQPVPQATAEALLLIYVSLLNDLIPLMDGAGVLRDHSNGKSSLHLIKAICVVTCKTAQAAPFLRLTESGPLLEPTRFAAGLLEGLNAAIKADLITDRIAKIQILALIHLNNDGSTGLERSASLLSQAITEAWSMWLQRDIPGNPDQRQHEDLFWTLRNLDRLNKVLSGAAPFIIDDTDIGIKRMVPSKDNYRSQLLDVSLRLGDLILMATKVYKASSNSTVDDCQEFPSLDEITTDIDFDRFHKSHKIYIEIWYHVAAMLSCRFSGPGSAVYNRRLSSADRVLQILSQDRHRDLPPLPLIPYAMSMSTTVIYRALRNNSRSFEVAQSDLKACCSVLSMLGRQWTRAKRVAALVHRLLRDLKPSVSAPRQAGTSLNSSAGTTVAEHVNGTVHGEQTNSGGEHLQTSEPMYHMENIGLQVLDDASDFYLQPFEPWADPENFSLPLDWSFYNFEFGDGFVDNLENPPSAGSG